MKKQFFFIFFLIVLTTTAQNVIPQLKDVLNMTFNNSQGTVKAYLNGGEQIDLKEKKAASGIWYANDHYELSGKGNHYELKKDGKIIFKN